MPIGKISDDPLPTLKASWEASVRISEGAENRGPDNRGSTVSVFYNNTDSLYNE